MGILSKIFGDSKNASTIVEGAVSGLDKIAFTDEERAEHAAKMGDWYLRFLEATNPQNVARRFIAMVVSGVWAFLVVFSVIVFRFDKELAEYSFKTMTEAVLNPFMIIMGFYFAAHVVRSWNGKTK